MSELLNNTPETPEVETVEVRTDIEASWQLKQRKEIIDERDELIAFYKERIKAVEEDAAFKIGNIERALYSYYLTVPHKKTATQEYYRHPLGKLVMKKQAPTFDRDDVEVIAWLKQNGGAEFIRTKEELDWNALKKATTVVGSSIVTEDGEPVPGVTVTEREDKFCIE